MPKQQEFTFLAVPVNQKDMVTVEAPARFFIP
jgi:hypothetical protein